MSVPKTLLANIEEFLSYESGVRGLSPHTVAGYRQDLYKLTNFLGEDCAIESVTKEDLRYCVGMLTSQGTAASSVNRFIAACRSLFAYCYRFQYIKNNPALEVKTVKQPQYLPKFMTASEIDALCAQPEVKELLWKERDKALFELLYSSGCRVSEVAGLTLDDLSSDLKRAIVHGKGGKDRQVFFEEDTRNALREYFPQRALRIPKERGVKALFINHVGRPLTPRGIRYIIARYSGVEGTNRPVSPHAFRHTFATSMVAKGADVRFVQEMLGHSSISTTQRYTHIGREQLIDIYNRAHPHGGNTEKAGITEKNPLVENKQEKEYELSRNSQYDSNCSEKGR